MAGVFSPQSVGVTAPSGGFTNLGWFNGRQYYNGTLSEPGKIHPQSPQQGAGERVSSEVNRQSAAAQGVTPDKFESFLEAERSRTAAVTPTASFNVPDPSTFPGGGSGAGPTLDVAASTPATLNLPELFDSLTRDSGVSELEKELSDKNKAFIDAQGQINDNPFLSEATRVGRLQKLDDDFQKRTANLRNDIETRKADIETRLNLETKQFDINSQVAQDALNRFNVLLGLGALDNASGSDVAALTRTTGLSSSMIQGAVQANRAKGLQTSVQSYDDGTNQGVKILTVDQSGNITNVATEVLGPSKPAGGSGAGSFFDFGGGGDTPNPWSIVSDTPSGISDLWESVGSPNFSPSGGEGSIFTDPSTGNRFKFVGGQWTAI